MATGGIFQLIPNENPHQKKEKEIIASENTSKEVKPEKKITILEYIQKKNKEIADLISEKLKKGKT